MVLIMRTKPHPPDIQLSKQDATYNPLPDTYLAWSHSVQHDLAVDFDVYSNYIALDLVA